jgi:hypothetical protein
MANIYKDEAPDFSSPKVSKRKYFGKDTGPNMGKVNKPKKRKPVKVTEKEVTVETMPTGEIGSVDFNTEVAMTAPDMGRTNIPAPVVERSINASRRNEDPSKVVDSDRSTWIDPQRQAQKMMGFKAGGKVSSASKRGDGCCVRGKTKGRMV